jgi:hypothetical protein
MASHQPLESCFVVCHDEALQQLSVVQLRRLLRLGQFADMPKDSR